MTGPCCTKWQYVSEFSIETFKQLELKACVRENGNSFIIVITMPVEVCRLICSYKSLELVWMFAFLYNQNVRTLRYDMLRLFSEGALAVPGDNLHLIKILYSLI